MHLYRLITWTLLFLRFKPASGGSDSVSSELPGDVIIIGMYEGYVAGEGGCGEVDVPSVMAMEATRWTIDMINKAAIVPFPIGFQGYSTCGSLHNSADLANTIVCDAKMRNSSGKAIIGVIGPKYSSESEVVSSIVSKQLLENRLLQLGFSATAATLDNKDVYSNFYRVIPDDILQVKTMTQLMVSLQWTRIAIIYENDTYGHEAAIHLQREATNNHICIARLAAIAIDSSRTVSIVQIKGILDNLVIGGTKIGAIVFIGNRDVANKVLLVTESLAYRDVPIYMMPEAVQLQKDVFKKTDGAVFTKSLGSLLTSVPYDEIGGFKTYWMSLFSDKEAVLNESASNPFLKDVFESYSGCSLEDASCQVPSLARLKELTAFQPTYIRYAVMATHVMAKALKSLYLDACDGPCSSAGEFLNRFTSNMMIDAMDGLEVNFPNDYVLGIQSGADRKPMTLTFDSSTANPQYKATDIAYEVYNFVQFSNGTATFKKIGEVTNEQLTLNKAEILDYDENNEVTQYPNVRTGQCEVSRECNDCTKDDVSELVYHIPGDIYVIGIASINNKHIENPQGCGTVRTRHGFQMVLAMEFGLNTFLESNEYLMYRQKFGGVKVGLVVLNSCNNALQIDRKILNLHRDGVTLPDGTRLDLQDRILGYVGGQATDVSEPAAAQLSRLGVVQISYSSTNPSLSDNVTFPYFMRIVTPDNVQATAMMQVVKELDGEYIQLVHSDGKYGEGGRDYVIQAAKEKGVCITQVIEVQENENYFEYYELMRRKPHAKVVIIFLRSHVVGPFMKDLDSLMEPGEFQFIGSEAWATNTEMLQYDVNKGSLTMTLHMEKNVALDNFIKSKTSVWGLAHPWLDEYLQNRQDCYFPWSFNKQYSKQCAYSNLPMADANFNSDPWCIFATNTMLSFLKGSAMFYQQKCGGTNSKSRICSEYIKNPAGLVEEMKKVKLDIHGTGPISIYNALGDGSMGYTIYNIRQTEGTSYRDYVEVGSYSMTTGLTFNKGKVRFPTDTVIKSTCPNEKACEACRKPINNTTKENGEVEVGTYVLGSFLGVAVLTIAFLSIVILKSRRPKEDPYLTPTEVNERQVPDGYELNDIEDMHK